MSNFIPWNLNYIVKAKLNDFGVSIFYKFYDYERAPSVDSEGYTEFQMWEFMHIYGKYMYNGVQSQPFGMDVLIQAV